VAIVDTVLLAPEVTDEPSGYLDSLILRAQALMLSAYGSICDLDGTRLDEYPTEGDDPILDSLCAELVIAMYRRGGAEHATNVSMGDYSYTAADIPAHVAEALKKRRAPAWDL